VVKNTNTNTQSINHSLV